MEFYHYFPSVTFVVLRVDQFVGRDDGPLEQQKQDNRVCRRNGTVPLIFSYYLMQKIGVALTGHQSVAMVATQKNKRITSRDLNACLQQSWSAAT